MLEKEAQQLKVEMEGDDFFLRPQYSKKTFYDSSIHYENHCHCYGRKTFLLATCIPVYHQIITKQKNVWSGWISVHNENSEWGWY
jgi:hypothetical protein